MRDAERLVEVQMADIRPDIRRAAQSDLRIQVGAIHVNLAAMGVDDFTNLFDGFFKNAVR
jgi:hypothetical protein